MKLPTPLYKFGQLVYQRANTDNRGVVTGYVFRPGGVILYLVSWAGGDEKEHWGVELTDEVDYRVVGDDEGEENGGGS